MEDKIYNPDSKELGITYGLAHLEGIYKFLISHEFKKEGESWIAAFDIDTNISLWSSLMDLVKKTKESRIKGW